VLLGLTLGLAVAEVGARAWLEWLPQPKNGTYLRDPRIGYRLRPQPAGGDTAGNPYHVNALGFRDHEHAPTKPAGIHRVLGIGDSFVAGEVRPADNFLRVAERAWNAMKPRPAAERNWNGMAPGRLTSLPDSVEVVLMGLGGYGPQQYLGTLRSVGLATAPDLVLLCFYTGNDVIGIPTHHEVRRGELYSTSSSDPRLDILRRSHLFAWLEKRFFFRLRRERVRERLATEAAGAPAGVRELRATETEGTPAEVSASPPSNAVAARDISGRPTSPAPLTRLYLEVLRNRLPFYAASPPIRIERLWTEAEGYLDAFDRACREATVPWALVIIPDEFQVDPAVREEAIRRLGVRGDDLALDAPPRRLTRWAADRGVPALDLLPLFREEQARRGPLYIPSDTHWNEEGNHLAGEAIARFADGLPGWRPRHAGAPATHEADRTGGTTP
jgi:Arc/MetJ family transcription regulator